MFLCIALTAAAGKKDDPNPEALPLATQSGKNTFGCNVNGKIWVPYSPNTMNRNLTPGFGNAYDIMATRTMKGDGTDKEMIKFTIFVDADNPVRPYIFNKEVGVIYKDRRNGCEYYGEPDAFSEGSFTITKFDLEEKVWAGTFEFSVATEGCDTIKATEGLFDIKIP